MFLWIQIWTKIREIIVNFKRIEDTIIVIIIGLPLKEIFVDEVIMEEAIQVRDLITIIIPLDAAEVEIVEVVKILEFVGVLIQINIRIEIVRSRNLKKEYNRIQLIFLENMISF